MMKIFLLRVTGNIYEKGDNAVHYAGCPYREPQELDLARTFKTASAAKATNEYKHWGYEVVEGRISVEVTE